MEVQKEAFNSLIEYYKNLPIDVKRKEIINELGKIVSQYSELCSSFGIVPDVSLNKEMLNFDKNISNEEDFLSATYAYLNALEDISSQILTKFALIYEDKDM